jgi:hypothetical protein
VAGITELQLQHFQLFADLHWRILQHFWQTAAYMRRLWHKIAVLPLRPFMPFVPIRPSYNPMKRF